MKRFMITLICITLSLASFSALPVYAAEPSYSTCYAKAVGSEAYFFSLDKTSSLFAVPEGYCIEILGSEGDWYHARYASDTGYYRAVEGYCRKSNFKEVDGTPDVTYLYLIVSVTLTSGNGTESRPVLNRVYEAAYYGVYKDGGTVYSYVYCSPSFGYVAQSFEHLVEKPSEPDEPSLATSSTTEQTQTTVSAGLICAIVIGVLFVAVIAILYFTAGKKTRGTK